MNGSHLRDEAEAIKLSPDIAKLGEGDRDALLLETLQQGSQCQPGRVVNVAHAD